MPNMKHRHHQEFRGHEKKRYDIYQLGETWTRGSRHVFNTKIRWQQLVSSRCGPHAKTYLPQLVERDWQKPMVEWARRWHRETRVTVRPIDFVQKKDINELHTSSTFWLKFWLQFWTRYPINQHICVQRVSTSDSGTSSWCGMLRSPHINPGMNNEIALDGSAVYIRLQQTAKYHRANRFEEKALACCPKFFLVHLLLTSTGHSV